MDRDALVLRNRSMTAAFHATPLKHQIRRALLTTLASLPHLPARHAAQQRILLIRPDHLGDVLLTTPAIRALRAALPNAELHALVGPWSARVLSSYSEIDTVLTLPFPGFSREPNESLRSPYQMAFGAARHLRRIAYNAVIIFRPDHWWGAMVAHLANIPERIGYNLPDTAPFLTRAIEHTHEHAVIQNLRLVEHWSGPLVPENVHFEYPINHADRLYVDGYLTEWGITPQQPIFCIHAGSGTWVKQWPEEHWSAVADILFEQLDARVVFTGGEHELGTIKRITSRMKQPSCIIAGETHIGQLAALYARARVVLGPDSGPLHLASAVGTPTVTLYGPADPLEFGPWGSQDEHLILASDIGCRPCRVLDWADDSPEYHPCLRDITVAQVLEAARRAAR
ncbi:MAG: glycosyltransferase family 9 protein [Anaerolineae bacterium]|nr:glycosyltransferase family 9 protein [Anaerolineae bacterium]